MRRRRLYVLLICFIIISFFLLLQLKHAFIRPLPDIIAKDVTLTGNITLGETFINCSGNPLKQWCSTKVKLCDSLTIVYNRLFVVTRAIILQPSLATGNRVGGEHLHDVLNQPEKDEYFHFQKEFIKLPCNDVQTIQAKIPRGHLFDIFSTATSYDKFEKMKIINETTIAVNRQDYVNFYHTITDLYTVYLLCRFFQRDPKSVRILFLDAHPKGNLDIIWSQLFHSYTRLGHLRTARTVFFREVIWSQPQHQSEIDIDRRRRDAPSFFAEFRQHVLEQFKINYKTDDKVNCQSLNIFFLVRHNYVAHPRNPSGQIRRQLPNEKEVLSSLEAKLSNYSNVYFSYNNFEEMSIVEQLSTVIRTDIFVGMHGAGLTHVIFMKSNRYLIELAPLGWQNQIHFELMASMNKIYYRRCLINEEWKAVLRKTTDCITQIISNVCPTILHR